MVGKREQRLEKIFADNWDLDTALSVYLMQKNVNEQESFCSN